MCIAARAFSALCAFQVVLEKENEEAAAEEEEEEEGEDPLSSFLTDEIYSNSAHYSVTFFVADALVPLPLPPPPLPLLQLLWVFSYFPASILPVTSFFTNSHRHTFLPGLKRMMSVLFTQIGGRDHHRSPPIQMYIYTCVYTHTLSLSRARVHHRLAPELTFCGNERGEIFALRLDCVCDRTVTTSSLERECCLSVYWYSIQ